MRATQAGLILVALLAAGCRDELAWIPADAGVEPDAGESGDAGTPDAGGTCAAPRDECGTSCVDLASDPAHCGECGHACERGARCAERTCQHDYEWASWQLPSTDDGNYLVDPGTVTDKTTGLIWQRQPDPDARTWAAAASYCETLALGGAAWRLPTRIELRSLVDATVGLPAINAAAFPETPPDNCWTSTRVAGVPDQAWTVHFGSGHTFGKVTDDTARVRCVRTPASRRNER